ncbi:hypothetical protein GCM10025783_04910 [Amnibacterium soli]|uniref:Uncharacterized protein n=1 Tax=Amnibacterium soli TaxID=1282736 RepID=A0ABP8YUC4_9MICO
MPSPAPSGTSTRTVAPGGRSSRIASAPSMSRIARLDEDPCHWGTTTNLAGMGRAYVARASRPR